MVTAAPERVWRTPIGCRAGVIMRLALGLGLWLLWSAAFGWTPYGPYGAPPAGAPAPAPAGQWTPPQIQGQPWQFRPTPPDNSRGAPPTYPMPPQGPLPGPAPYGLPGQIPRPPSGPYPGPAPGQGYQPNWPGGYAAPSAPTQRTLRPPRLEWSLDASQPYVQENLLLRLDLISPDELTTADPDLAGQDAVLLQKLAGPTTSTRGSGDSRELVTQFWLVLTPLRAGDLTLPPPKITGMRPGNYGAPERYEAVGTSPIALQVRPAMATVHPWLPLRSLSLNAVFDRPERVEPGQPVTLVLESTAAGGLAAQLPNLEEQLVSPDFRIYREQTLSANTLSKDGRQLTATRTEYYTLVPQGGGTLRLPEIKVPWWNLETGSRQVATLPIRTLSIEGATGPLGLAVSLIDAGAGWSRVWLPITGILLVLAGYWIGVLYQRRLPGVGLNTRLRSWSSQTIDRSMNGSTRLLKRLDPTHLAARAKAAAIRRLPESSRLLMCVRDAHRARDPVAWSERFERSARHLLHAPDQGGAPNLTERILTLRPRADRTRLTRLMHELDRALYGRQPLDFARWKRDFMRQVGRTPNLIRPRRPETRIRRAALPALNPGGA